MAATNAATVHVTDASFAGEIEQANGLVLVDFWATWCGPCQIVAPILEQLAGEYVGRAKVAKVDVDANQRTAMRFNVRSIPEHPVLQERAARGHRDRRGAEDHARGEDQAAPRLGASRDQGLQGGACRRSALVVSAFSASFRHPKFRACPAPSTSSPRRSATSATCPPAPRRCCARCRWWPRRTPAAPAACSPISAPRPSCSATTRTPRSGVWRRCWRSCSTAGTWRWCPTRARRWSATPAPISWPRPGRRA